MNRKRRAACRASDLIIIGIKGDILSNAMKKSRKAPMTRKILPYPKDSDPHSSAPEGIPNN